MANKKKNQDEQQSGGNKKRLPGSTTSLGKRRSLAKTDKSSSRKSTKSAASSGSGTSPKQTAQAAPTTQPTVAAPTSTANEQQQQQQKQPGSHTSGLSASPSPANPTRSSDYGSQASSIRSVPLAPKELTKVAILGAAGGIGQPLGLLLMLHSEYVHHLALYDLMDSVHGVGTDLSHVDRQCKVTTHLGEGALADAVRGAKVIVVPAGLAQRPGMSRDDLFGSNAKIMYNLAKVCAQVAPDAMLAIITNPVNSLVPLACEVYQRFCASGGAAVATTLPPVSPRPPILKQQQQQQQQGNQQPTPTATDNNQTNNSNNQQQQSDKDNQQQQQQQQSASATQTNPTHHQQPTSPTLDQARQMLMADCHRRIFGVTTLDVVRASTLLARSAFYKAEPNGLFRDPAGLQVPVVGGHAGKTIMPLLSQAAPKLNPKRLVEERASTSTLVDSIQQAGIEVLNNKRGKGSATLAMAYAACRFTVSLLRAQLGEPNIVECAYVRHQAPIYADLEYFAAPLLIGKDGYTKSLGIAKQLLPYEEQMLEEGARELRLSIVKGEDFAKEHLSAEV